MSQFYWGTVEPTTTSGTALATLLTQGGASFLSNHKGPVRPTYATAGMVWADDTVDLYLKLHDGTDDGELGYMDAGEWHAKSASCFWLQYNNVGTAKCAGCDYRAVCQD
jgi:hypothetical protein